MTHHPHHRLPMDVPRWYVIHAEGALDPAWWDRLGGLRVAVSAPSGRAATELSGRVQDQAALMGVLTCLYDLGLPLLSVACRPARRAAGERLTTVAGATEPRDAGGDGL